MTIKDTLMQLFKSSNEKDTGVFGETFNQDFSDAKFSVDDFEKKYNKRINKLIKKISSLSNDEKEKVEQKISEAFQMLKNCNVEILYKVAPNIDRKYKIAHSCLEKYQKVILLDTAEGNDVIRSNHYDIVSSAMVGAAATILALLMTLGSSSVLLSSNYLYKGLLISGVVSLEFTIIVGSVSLMRRKRIDFRSTLSRLSVISFIFSTLVMASISIFIL